MVRIRAGRGRLHTSHPFIRDWSHIRLGTRPQDSRTETSANHAGLIHRCSAALDAREWALAGYLTQEATIPGMRGMILGLHASNGTSSLLANITAYMAFGTHRVPITARSVHGASRTFFWALIDGKEGGSG